MSDAVQGPAARVERVVMEPQGKRGRAVYELARCACGQHIAPWRDRCVRCEFNARTGAPR